MLELLLLRHAETAGNRRKNYIGRTDEPLSPEGMENIWQRARDGFYPPAELLITSPLLRCRQTAQILYPHLKPLVISDLRECDFGDFENRNYQDMAEDAAYREWVESGGKMAFPGGESHEDFVQRICRGFDQAAAKIMQQKPKRTVIVGHGGTIMAILSAHTEGDYYDFMTPNGGGWRVWLDEKLWRQERRLVSPEQLFDKL